uniref:Uncharacterized protein n=1 Tax=Parastrongyloides trichosuri TaxID=131310 RepID=A0A0N5A722_PARTI
MVCLPCCILPILLAIYLKFIQPIILKYVPERWKAKVDAWLYPTCPLNLQQKTNNIDEKEEKEEGGCCKDKTAGTDSINTEDETKKNI